MATALEQIEHIFILMMENRSFDHMLGYLDASNPKIMGIANASAAGYANLLPNGTPYPPQTRVDPTVLEDPLHERDAVALQMAPANQPAMTGFVQNYATVSANDPEPVGQYYTANAVSTMDFLARNFRLCDRWFSCLPTSTQPNRLMAASGYTLRDFTEEGLLTNQNNMVYDWLIAHGVSWRVYSEGFPFFSLMPSIRRKIFSLSWGGCFRGFTSLKPEIQGDADFPQVTFIEPAYTDASHPNVGANDDHPTTSIAAGQEFLRLAYDAVTSNPECWRKSLLIIYYDEHGGFFDHVEPPAFETPQNHGETYDPFKTLGVRVPGLIVSPFVTPGTCFHGTLDHTSVLKLLAEKYSPGRPYSADVDARTLVQSLSVALDLNTARTDLPGVPDAPVHATRLAQRPSTPFPSPNATAFFNAAAAMRRTNPETAAARFPAWKDYFLRGR
jgi:phospholipase C